MRGDACPLDVVHEHIAVSLLCTNDGDVVDKRTDGLIFKDKDGYFDKWAKSVPEVAAHVAWLAVADEVQQAHQGRADWYAAWPTAAGIGTVEPRLVLRTAWQLAARGQFDEARALLAAGHIEGSTNPGQQALADAQVSLEVHALKLAQARDTTPKSEVKARPRDRVRVNPFTIT